MTTITCAMRVATQLQSEGKLAQAKIILDSILDVAPTQAYALHLSGIIAYQLGNTVTGIQLIQQAIANHATDALFYSNLAEMYRQLKMIELSIQHGEKAVICDPNSATALSNLGIAYYDAKQYEKAEDCHKRALVINPTLRYSLNNMGSIYQSLGKTQQAIAFYQAAITVAPTFVDAHCNMGFALLGLSQYDEALLSFEKALQLQSNDTTAYYGIAKVHLHKHNFIESENRIRKAICMNPQQVEYHQLLAEIHHEQGNNVAALIHLDHALSIDSTSASLYLSKGQVLMEMGEIDRAEQQFLRITENSAVDTRLLAHYCLVQLRKIEANNPNFKTLLTITDRIQEVSSHQQHYAYFALGKCYDDMGEWKKAFSYFTQGCHLKRNQINYDMTEQIQLTNNIINTVTKDTIAYLRMFANPSDLPIFIVGMPRSGTTLIEQIIASLPNIHGAGELTYLNDLIQHPVNINKAKLYYPDNLAHLLPEIYYSITEKYLAYLRLISADAIHIIDKMPQNFTLIGLIHALFPNAKIIHVKRNPIDTCLSCYTKLFAKGQHYSYDLTELGQYYRCYEMIMDHWRRILPASAWLDVNYEDVIQHTETEAKRLIAYCNLTWDPKCLAFYESKRTVRTASFMQVRQPVYTSSLSRWRRFEKELAPLIEILNQSW